MKKTLLFVILLLNVIMYAQKKSSDYIKMIDSAITIKSMQTLEDFNQELAKSKNTDNWKAYISNYKKRIENTYLIDENHNPFVFFPSKELNIKFKQMNIYDPRNIKMIKKGIDVWKIVCTLEGSNMKIDIIDFTISYYNKKYEFVNGGGTTVIFGYSCEEKRWVFVSKKNNIL